MTLRPCYDYNDKIEIINVGVKVSPYVFVGLEGIVPNTVLNCPMITSLVSSYLGVKLKELYSRTRRAEVTNARYLLWWLLHKHTTMNKSQIGAEFKKDHSTVINGLNRFKDYIETEEIIYKQLNEIETILEIPSKKRTLRYDKKHKHENN